MLCAVVVDSPAALEKATGLLDAAAVRQREATPSRLSQDCGCHFRPRSYAGIRSSRHSLLVEAGQTYLLKWDRKPWY